MIKLYKLFYKEKTNMDNKKKKIIVILSIALAVVIVAVIICLTVFGKDKGETSNNETSTHTSELTTEEPTTEEPATEEPTTEEPAAIVTETESPTEAPTVAEEITIPEELQSKKDYTITWSNPYFFTKKFSNGTEQVYFTFRANLELFGMETTAVGVIPEDARYLIDYEPEYYINGQTESPNNNGSISNTEATTENKGNTSGSNNTSNESDNSSSNNPYKDMVGQHVEIDGVDYFVGPGGVLEEVCTPGTMTEEEYQEFAKWCRENGITMH